MRFWKRLSSWMRSAFGVEIKRDFIKGVAKVMHAPYWSGNLAEIAAALEIGEPLLLMEAAKALHEVAHFHTIRVVSGVIFFGRLDDDVDHVREAATATAALAHGVIHLRGHNELPTVLIKEFVDNVPDFFVGDEITATNQHGFVDRET
ncbi:hypothetical protein [Ciceribacter sichuanensis]|uniref:hypothetical protein n=1 Tax=Ciceribacter sichuanensis TaxID=2949647 RepID=UPI003CC91E48